MALRFHVDCQLSAARSANQPIALSACPGRASKNQYKIATKTSWRTERVPLWRLNGFRISIVGDSFLEERRSICGWSLLWVAVQVITRRSLRCVPRVCGFGLFYCGRGWWAHYTTANNNCYGWGAGDVVKSSWSIFCVEKRPDAKQNDARLPLSLSQIASFRYASSITVIIVAKSTLGKTFNQLSKPVSGNISLVQSC